MGYRYKERLEQDEARRARTGWARWKLILYVVAQFIVLACALTGSIILPLVSIIDWLR